MAARNFRYAERVNALNQPPPLVDYNLFTSDAALLDALRRECAAWAEPQATTFGAILGREETQRWGFQANEYPPVLRTHDRFGSRIDQVEFHPAWHNLMHSPCAMACITCPGAILGPGPTWPAPL